MDILSPRQQILQEIFKLEAKQPRALRECLLYGECDIIKKLDKDIEDLREVLAQYKD